MTNFAVVISIANSLDDPSYGCYQAEDCSDERMACELPDGLN